MALLSAISRLHLFDQEAFGWQSLASVASAIIRLANETKAAAALLSLSPVSSLQTLVSEVQ